jgi:hypothetical protein
MRDPARVLVLSLVLGAAAAHAAPVQLVIHNGLAPPVPENVIDADYDPFLFDVFVRNVGCGEEFPFDGPCATPGAPTRVALVEGGVINDRFEVFDTSMLDVTGGSALLLRAYGASAVFLRGGTVTNTLEATDASFVSITGGSVEQFLRPMGDARVELEGGTVARILSAGWSRTEIHGGTIVDHVAASGYSTVTMRGGTVGTFLAAFFAGRLALRGGSVGAELSTNGELVEATWSGGRVGGVVQADGGSTITIRGSGFALDGVPQPYGPLPSQQGFVCGTKTLSGTLASGEAFVNPVAHDGCFDAPLGRELTGTIVVPEPPARPAGAAVLGVLLAAALRARAVASAAGPPTRCGSAPRSPSDRRGSRRRRAA